MILKFCSVKKILTISVFWSVITHAEPVIDSIMPQGKACGQIYLDQKKIKIKVECDSDSTKCFSEINKIGKENGVTRCFTKSGRLHDYVVYKNGLVHGPVMLWDSSGELTLRGNELNDNRYGLYERWFTKTNATMGYNGNELRHLGPLPKNRRPRMVYHYNAKGQEDGEIKEWWPNGNLKLEAIAKNGQYIENTDYYPNGNPRVTNKTPYDPTGKRAAMDGILFEKTYNPKGKAISEVKNGNGESILFKAFPDSATGTYDVTKGIIKKGSLVDVKKLTKQEVSQLLEF